jgi:hypothetical protein
VQPWYTNLTFWAYAFAWLPFFLFVVIYATKSPWQTTPVGRGMMALAASLTAVLTFVMVVISVPLPDDVKTLLRGATMGGVALSGYLQLKNLLVILHRRKTDPDCPRRRATDLP